jgi:NTE family protein
VLFTALRDAVLPNWHRDPLISFRRVTLTLEHVRASSAIPFLFPAVEIDGDLYCDGGLRQTVPLSPARRLGAESLVVVSPHCVPPADEPVEKLRSREAAAAGPYFLLGKTLDALVLDRIDSDIERMERVNAILEAGTREFGPQFVRRLNARLRADGESGDLRPLRTVAVRASEDIGRLSLEYARSKTFAKRTRGIAARLIRRLAEGEGGQEADFVSYLLFDGPFAQKLLDLGWADAAARHDQLCQLFDGACSEHAA